MTIADLDNPPSIGHYPVTLATSADTGSATATVAVTPAVPSPAQSSVSADPDGVPADGTTSSTVTVTELDAYGNPVVGDTVVLNPSSGSHAAVTPPTATTSAGGVATFTVTDTVMEDVPFAAVDTTAAVTVGTATVDFTQPAGRTAVAGLAVAPGGPATSFVAGATTTYDLSFTTSAVGALGAGATVTLLGPAGTGWPSAPSDYALSTSTVSSVSGAGTVASPLVLTLGSSSVGDDSPVTLTATGVGDPRTAATTDTVVASTSADTAEVASVPYAVVAGQPVVDSSVVASPAVVAVGGSSTVTVTEVDAYGNPVEGDTVVLAPSSGSQATATPPAATTSAGGVATFTVTDPDAEDVTWTATDTTAGVTFAARPAVDFVTPAVTGLAVAPGGPATSFVAGATTTYDLSFTTSAVGALGAGATVSLRRPGRQRVAQRSGRLRPLDIDGVVGVGSGDRRLPAGLDARLLLRRRRLAGDPDGHRRR